MPATKVTYFDIKGLAEPIRVILSYANVDFEDDRLSEEEWINIKLDTPFGQVPVVEIDGKKINQSTAICRYLAKQHGLTGSNDWEDLEIDATVDTIHDMRTKITAYHYELHPEVKAGKQAIAKQIVPFYIQRLDAQVKKNGGYFVGGKLTWADLVFVGLLDYLNFMEKRDIIEDAENLKALRAKVLELPGVKAWMEKRPKTDC